MSCYVVSNKTISVIAKGIVDYGLTIDGVELDTMQTIFVNGRYQPYGQALLNQNYKSVNARYDEDSEAPRFYYEDVEFDEGTLLGCINCYNYQSCETNDYEDGSIARVLTKLKDEMLHRMISQKGQEIPWGIA